MNECPICSGRFKDVYRHVLMLVPGDALHTAWVEARGISSGGVAGYDTDALAQLREALATAN